jgi:hypothetical protein
MIKLETLIHASTIGDRTMMIFFLTGVFNVTILRWLSGLSMHSTFVDSSNILTLRISYAIFSVFYLSSIMSTLFLGV